jgi:hypothetical protein
MGLFHPYGRAGQGRGHSRFGDFARKPYHGRRYQRIAQPVIAPATVEQRIAQPADANEPLPDGSGFKNIGIIRVITI